MCLILSKRQLDLEVVCILKQMKLMLISDNMSEIELRAVFEVIKLMLLE